MVLMAVIWLFIPEVKGHNVTGKKPLGEVFKDLISTYILFARCVIASPSLILLFVSCFGLGCSCERSRTAACNQHASACINMHNFGCMRLACM